MLSNLRTLCSLRNLPLPAFGQSVRGKAAVNDQHEATARLRPVRLVGGSSRALRVSVADLTGVFRRSSRNTRRGCSHAEDRKGWGRARKSSASQRLCNEDTRTIGRHPPRLQAKYKEKLLPGWDRSGPDKSTQGLSVRVDSRIYVRGLLGKRVEVDNRLSLAEESE